MTEGKRPGGLTALAVINFIFFISSILSLVTFAVRDRIPVNDEMTEAQRAQVEAFQNLGTPTVILLSALTLATGALLLLSGIGYLKQKRFLGWVLGNAYGGLAIVSNVVSALVVGTEIGGGFNFGVLIGLIYPVLTLILINTTFKGDLVN